MVEYIQYVATPRTSDAPSQIRVVGDLTRKKLAANGGWLSSASKLRVPKQLDDDAEAVFVYAIAQSTSCFIWLSDDVKVHILKYSVGWRLHVHVRSMGAIWRKHDLMADADSVIEEVNTALELLRDALSVEKKLAVRESDFMPYGSIDTMTAPAEVAQRPGLPSEVVHSEKGA